MNSGIYIRIETENKLFEEMTDEQRIEWLKLDINRMLQCINILSKVLYKNEQNIYKVCQLLDNDDLIKDITKNKLINILNGGNND